MWYQSNPFSSSRQQKERIHSVGHETWEDSDINNAQQTGIWIRLEKQKTKKAVKAQKSTADKRKGIHYRKVHQKGNSLDIRERAAKISGKFWVEECNSRLFIHFSQTLNFFFFTNYPTKIVGFKRPIIETGFVDNSQRIIIVFENKHKGLLIIRNLIVACTEKRRR